MKSTPKELQKRWIWFDKIWSEINLCSFRHQHLSDVQNLLIRHCSIWSEIDCEMCPSSSVWSGESPVGTQHYTSQQIWSIGTSHHIIFIFINILYIYLIHPIISSWSFDLVTGNGPQKMGRIYEAWSSKMESSALICKCSGQTNTKAHLAGQVKKYWLKIFGGNILSSPWDVFILPPIITP